MRFVRRLSWLLCLWAWGVPNAGTQPIWITDGSVLQEQSRLWVANVPQPDAGWAWMEYDAGRGKVQRQTPQTEAWLDMTWLNDGLGGRQGLDASKKQALSEALGSPRLYALTVSGVLEIYGSCFHSLLAKINLAEKALSKVAWDSEIPFDAKAWQGYVVHAKAWQDRRWHLRVCVILQHPQLPDAYLWCLDGSEYRLGEWKKTAPWPTVIRNERMVARPSSVQLPDGCWAWALGGCDQQGRGVFQLRDLQTGTLLQTHQTDAVGTGNAFCYVVGVDLWGEGRVQRFYAFAANGQIWKWSESSKDSVWELWFTPPQASGTVRLKQTPWVVSNRHAGVDIIRFFRDKADACDRLGVLSDTPHLKGPVEEKIVHSDKRLEACFVRGDAVWLFTKGSSQITRLRIGNWAAMAPAKRDASVAAMEEVQTALLWNRTEQRFVFFFMKTGFQLSLSPIEGLQDEKNKQM